jgi:hypothetical protein
VAVLIASNGKETREWSGNRQPTVLLAYTSTLANAFLVASFAEAVVIKFWQSAIKGTSVCLN